MGNEGRSIGAGTPRPRQRFAKGRRPYFMKDPDVDRLLAIVTALAAEVSVTRERLDTVERLTAEGLPASPENIERYEPPPNVQAARESARAALLDRVFRILAAPMEDQGAEAEYQSVIDQFA